MNSYILTYYLKNPLKFWKIEFSKTVKFWKFKPMEPMFCIILVWRPKIALTPWVKCFPRLKNYFWGWFLLLICRLGVSVFFKTCLHFFQVFPYTMPWLQNGQFLKIILRIHLPRGVQKKTQNINNSETHSRSFCQMLSSLVKKCAA